MSQWTAEAANQALTDLYKRAATDKEFRQLCLSRPEEAVKQAAGLALPEGFTIRFVDNEGADATFVLPDLQEDGSELLDLQLEAVAGGKQTGISHLDNLQIPQFSSPTLGDAIINTQIKDIRISGPKG